MFAIPRIKEVRVLAFIGLLEVVADQLADVGLVFDDENLLLVVGRVGHRVAGG